jgi:DnaK suppressor protein
MTEQRADIDESRARELLARERERIEGSLADHRRVRASENEDAGDEMNPQDQGDEIEMEEVDDALVDQLENELAAVERAEERLADGSYGLSVESGEPIPAERLEAVPWAERTVEEEGRNGH